MFQAYIPHGIFPIQSRNYDQSMKTTGRLWIQMSTIPNIRWSTLRSVISEITECLESDPFNQYSLPLFSCCLVFKFAIYKKMESNNFSLNYDKDDEQEPQCELSPYLYLITATRTNEEEPQMVNVHILAATSKYFGELTRRSQTKFPVKDCRGTVFCIWNKYFVTAG